MDDRFDLMMNRDNYKWPVRPVEAPLPVRAVKPDNQVPVIGNIVSSINPLLSRVCTQYLGQHLTRNTQGDPIAPLAGAHSAADLLGDRATLVVQQSFGHTSLSDPSPCTLSIVKDYLLKSTIGLSFDVHGRNLTPLTCSFLSDYSYLKDMGSNAMALLNSFLCKTAPIRSAQSSTRLCICGEPG